jgi:hypothetical protein
MTYLRHKPHDIDLYFVLCNVPLALQSQILLEMEVHRDIIVMDCTENMNDGKTYDWFTYVYQHLPPYKFAFKGDDDTFIHLFNLRDDLLLQPWENIYYGRVCNNHPPMAGMLYGLSWNMVGFIASSAWVREHKVGTEDYVTHSWMRHINATFVSKEAAFYDHKLANSYTPWAKDYVKETIAIHQCKESERFIDSYLSAFQAKKSLY